MRKVSKAVWKERREVLLRAERSGLSLAAFARREGLAYWRLMAWKRRLRELDEASAESVDGVFAELVVVEPGTSAVSIHAPVEIALACGTTIRLRPGAEIQLLQIALASLAGDVRSC